MRAGAATGSTAVPGRRARGSIPRATAAGRGAVALSHWPRSSRAPRRFPEWTSPPRRAAKTRDDACRPTVSARRPANDGLHSFAFADDFEGRVARDAQHPGGKTSFPAKAGEIFQHAQKSLLGDILG